MLVGAVGRLRRRHSGLENTLGMANVNCCFFTFLVAKIFASFSKFLETKKT